MQIGAQGAAFFSQICVFGGIFYCLIFLYLLFTDSELVGHVIRKYSTLDALHCAHKCLAERPVCKSINFITKKQSDSGINCELNNATMSTYPNKLCTAKNVNYYEVVEKVRHQLVLDNYIVLNIFCYHTCYMVIHLYMYFHRYG